MTTIEVDIINPKADKLLRDLADMNLISIREISDNGFSKLTKKIRSKESRLTEKKTKSGSIWDDKYFVAEMKKRVDEVEKGLVKTYTWEEVQANMAKAVKKARLK